MYDCDICIYLVLGVIEAVAEGDVAGRVVAVMAGQPFGQSILQARVPAVGHNAEDSRHRKLRQDQRYQHAHVLQTYNGRTFFFSLLRFAACVFIYLIRAYIIQRNFFASTRTVHRARVKQQREKERELG